MPILSPEYDLTILNKLFKDAPQREPVLKHLFSYYIYLTTGISLYHADLLNIPLGRFFAVPSGRGRHFDLQELEHRFTQQWLNPNTASTRPINVKICLEWSRHTDCSLSDHCMTQLTAAVSDFTRDAFGLIGNLTPADYAQLGNRLVALNRLIKSTHEKLKQIIPRHEFQIRTPTVATLLDKMSACCDTNKELWRLVVRLAQLRLTPDAIDAINITLATLPADAHHDFFIELLRIADRQLRDLGDLKAAVIKYCDHVQQNQEWDDIALNRAITPLADLLALTKPKYVNNGRWPFRHNPRYLSFCDEPSPSVTKLVHLIVQETGRFGKLHPDSFICLLLEVAQQQHSLSLFNECLPMANIEPASLVMESSPWWRQLWHQRTDAPPPQQARDQLLQVLRQSARNISLP